MMGDARFLGRDVHAFAMQRRHVRRTPLPLAARVARDGPFAVLGPAETFLVFPRPVVGELYLAFRECLPFRVVARTPPIACWRVVSN